MTAAEQKIATQIDSLFTALNATDTLFPVKNKGNRYEVYTYLRLARQLLRFADASTFTPHNDAAGTFRFKAAPSPANDEFSYYSFKYNGHLFELRNGTEFQGHGMCHEVDISVSTPLTSGYYGPYPALRLAIECKYHSSASGLKGLFRSQVGAVLDLNGHHHNHSGCLHCGQTFSAFFVSQHPMTNVNGYLNYLMSYRIGPLFNFHPATSDRAVIYRLVKGLLPRLNP
jgi:hypothetical protein